MTQDEIDNIKYGEPMTTHNRDKVISAAKEADPGINPGTVDFLDEDGMEKLEKFYAIAFEDGRQAERIVTIKDDDDLRFIKRVLEGANQTEEDKAKCLQLIREIRIRARGDNK